MDSSSDEDVDILLRKASHRLGWSAKNNSEETLQMLQKNVEDSKKKKIPCSARRRRQTPRSRNKTANSLSGQNLTSKRTLSFKSSPHDSSQCRPKPFEGGTVNVSSLHLDKLNLNNTVSRPDHDLDENLERKDKPPKGQSHADVEKIIANHPSHSSKGDSSWRETLPNSGTGSKDHFNERKSTSPARVPGGELSPVSAVDGSGDSKDVQSSWSDYRGQEEKKQVSSHSEDDQRVGSVPETKSPIRVWSDDGSDSDLPSPPCSLSERLVKKFRDERERKRREGSSDDGAVAAATRETVPRRNQTSSDDDDFETFLQKIKTPQKTKPAPSRSEGSDDDFINDGPISEEDEGPLFYYQQENEGIEAGCLVETPTLKILSDQTNKSTASSKHVIVLSSSSDDEDVFTSPVKPRWTDRKTEVPSALKTHVNKPLEGKKRTFLKSLDTPPINVQSDSPYVKNFKKRRVELTAKLFAMYNKTVFDNKLPSNMQVLWNKRMLKTAGYCVYTKSKLQKTRDVRIELSEKVCNSAERLRDTLIHEMCHAACWLINGVNDGHGRFWKYWANKANLAHPDLPVIRRCHSYEINTKFKYQCQQCKSIVGRHSKSLDVTKKCCGVCRGRFVLLPTATGGKENKKQPPNKFAMFVKENYATIKKSNSDFKHADIMRTLSQEFSRKASLGN